MNYFKRDSPAVIGAVLPKKSGPLCINVQDLNIAEPIDIKTAMEEIVCNEKLYFSMLSRFEGMSLNECMEKISSALDFKDWNTL